MMTGIFRLKGALRGWYAHPISLSKGVLGSNASLEPSHFCDDALSIAQHVLTPLTLHAGGPGSKSKVALPLQPITPAMELLSCHFHEHVSWQPPVT